MKKLLKAYLSKRQEVFAVSTLFEVGEFLIQNADKMGKRRVLGPTEYEINEFKNDCVNLKGKLIDLVSHCQNKDSIPVELINQINDLKIINLNDSSKFS